MQLSPASTDLTTAATNALIAVFAVMCAGWLWRRRERDRWKVGVWCWVFVLLAAAALLGAVVHGFVLSDRTETLLWRPLYLFLGLLVALFVVASLYDWRGLKVAQRTLPFMLAVALIFYVITRLGSSSFLVFVLYEAAAMLFALGAYAALAVRRRMAGAAWVTAGIALNIVAAAIQAGGSVSFTFIWPFDHNGVFHLVQLVAIAVLVRGLLLSLEAYRWSG